jgi:hypothetical protein
VATSGRVLFVVSASGLAGSLSRDELVSVAHDIVRRMS